MMIPELDILALNSGSSSLKFGMYRIGSATTQLLMAGEAGSIGSANGTFKVTDSRNRTVQSEKTAIPGQRDAIMRIGKLLADSKLPAPTAIGHRIVHGGPRLLQHCLLDEYVLAELEAAEAFAPLHTPTALAVVRYAQEHFPGVPQSACFDTSFHAALPPVARTLPLPKELQREGIRRYGFHGLSCESIVRQVSQYHPERLVIAHLGSGSSITAVKSGQSIDTSMGLTPSGGVIMGTRTGDIDPGVLIYLLQHKQFDASMLAELVDRRSGLFGISGIDSDMRRLHAAAAANSDARLAIQMFCYSVRKHVAAMIAVLEGLDLLVFTGGIGEHDAKIRTAVCHGLSWLGISVDAARNLEGQELISDAHSCCAVRVLASQEDEQIARHTWKLMATMHR